MKKIALFFLAAFSAAGVAAQMTINDANAELRPVSSFHSISVSSGIDLYLSEGTEAIAVSAKDAATVKDIKVEVVNGVLKIWYDWKEKMVFTQSKQLRAYVAYKTLQSLSGSGGSDIFVDGVIRGTDLKLNLSGGSDFKGKVAVQTLDADGSGGSDIHISGTAATAKIDVSGGSDFHGYELATEKCDADASGGSDIHVTVTQELRADASGGSDVHYKGAPAQVTSNKSGGGGVHKAG